MKIPLWFEMGESSMLLYYCSLLETEEEKRSFENIFENIPG